jgi:hypothetical protein
MASLVNSIPEIQKAELSYVGIRQGDLWALVVTKDGMFEYRGTAQPLTRTAVDRDTDVNALVLQRSLEGFHDVTDYRGTNRGRRSRRRRRRSHKSK